MNAEVQPTPAPVESEGTSGRGTAKHATTSQIIKRVFTVVLSIEPTERALWAMVGVFALGVVSAGLLFLQPVLPALLGALVLLFVVDILLAGNPDRVQVHRQTSARWTLGEGQLVQIVVESPVPGRVQITDSGPLESKGDGDGRDVVHRSIRLRPSERSVLREMLTPWQRGELSFGRLSLRLIGPLGLMRRRQRRRVATTVHVGMDLKRLSAQAQRLLRGQDADGARRRALRQQGQEFDSLREYHRGDDVRLIEWKCSAKQGQLVVRRQVPETRQDVLLLVDVGRQMLGRYDEADGGQARLDVAVAAALTLAAAALRQGDRVGALLFGAEATSFVASQQGAGQLRRLGQAMDGVCASPEEAGYGEAARQVLLRQKRRAMVVLITDVVDVPSARSLATAMALLRGRHAPVVLAVGDPALTRFQRGPAAGDSNATDFVASPRGTEAFKLAANRLLQHRRHAHAAVRSTGALVIATSAQNAAADGVLAYLQAKSRLNG